MPGRLPRAVAFLVLLSTAACALPARERRIAPEAAQAPSAYWTPPASTVPASPAPASLPAEYQGRAWGLADVLDIALRLHPSTRVSWLSAQSALERYGIERAAYLPKVSLEGNLGARNTHNSGSGDSTGQLSAGASASLSWILLDFGTRAGALDQARQELLAANWTHNRTVQDLVLDVQRAYYGYLAAGALRDARRTSLRSAEVNLEAANQRHAAGVATLADVLQARTAAAQARLALQTADGAVQITRGALAASMGLPAHTGFDVVEVQGGLPVGVVPEQVGELIRAAVARRPDLAAARSQALASDAQVLRVRGEGLPALSLASSGGTTWFDVDGAGSDSAGDRREDAWGAALFLRYPLFTGLAQSHGEARARAAAESSREQVRGLEQQVVLQVFTAYYALQTAGERVKAAAELLASAEQSEAVALGRYREGVGTILDLLSAQGALADARAQSVQSRWEWQTARAQLAHDTGLLGLDGERTGGASP